MKTKFTVIICLIFLNMTTAFGQPDKKINDAIKAFDTFYQEGVKKYGIIGSSFAFVHEDKLLDHQTYGTAHIANNYKIDEKTIYHWASISKTLTRRPDYQIRSRTSPSP